MQQDHRRAPILQFLGGAGTVTGSRFLFDTDEARVLVDCGLYQGLKELRLRNWEPFPVPPESIDVVLVTHAHVDHSGWLPRLVREGFRGPIHCTRSTKDLCEVVLPDSGRLHEEEARTANRLGYSKHRPALPLYTERDAITCCAQLRPVPYDAAVDVAPGVRATFRTAGHILGSASVHLRLPGRDGSRSVVVSGDIGRPHHPVLSPPAPIGPADVVLVESTYGDRRHRPYEETLAALRDTITRTVDRGGVVVVPAFAVDRTEVLLHAVSALMDAGDLPALPIFADSPMALRALSVYRAAIREDRRDVKADLDVDGDPFDPGTLVEVPDVAGSKRINGRRDSCIIVSASGMATGGRILHHLARRLPNPRNTVILTGYQAKGTRGRDILEGAGAVKMLGRYVPIRAEVAYMPGFSVHADGDELLDWLATASPPPDVVHIVHGEPQQAESLRERVNAELGLCAVVARSGERVRLD